MTSKSKSRKAPKSDAAAKPVLSKPTKTRAVVKAASAPKALKSASKVTTPTRAAASKPVAPKAAPVKKASAAAKAVDPTRPVTFSFYAPEAGNVLVAGDFTQWEGSPIHLVKEQSGHWKTTVSLKPGTYQYRLLVDGQWQNDPGCSQVQPNEFGSQNCILSVAA